MLTHVHACCAASPQIARLVGAAAAAVVAVLGLKAVWAKRVAAAGIAFRNALAVRADPLSFERADLDQIGAQWGVDPRKQLVQELKGAYDAFISWVMPAGDEPLTYVSQYQHSIPFTVMTWLLSRYLQDIDRGVCSLKCVHQAHSMHLPDSQLCANGFGLAPSGRMSSACKMQCMHQTAAGGACQHHSAASSQISALTRSSEDCSPSFSVRLELLACPG